jgi:hypothetical protein
MAEPTMITRAITSDWRYSQPPDKSYWAAIHCVKRHGGRIEDVVVIEVRVPKNWLRRHGGKAKGLWRWVRNVPVKLIRRVVGFNVLSRSPIAKTAGK